MVEVTDLHMHFGAVRALNGVSFVAPDGAITGLLGETGQARPRHSTSSAVCIRRCAAPLLSTVAPLAIRSNDDGTSVRSSTRRGCIRGSPPVNGRISARCAFTGTELTRRVSRALAAVGIESLAERQTQGFSQGERMKVALARAIVHEPRNLILDEPTNGLDVPSARTFKAALSRMRELGVCIVFSSHLIHDVSALCDTVVIISRGRTVAQGEPEALCRKTGCSTLEGRSWR